MFSNVNQGFTSDLPNPSFGHGFGCFGLGCGRILVLKLDLDFDPIDHFKLFCLSKLK